MLIGWTMLDSWKNTWEFLTQKKEVMVQLNKIFWTILPSKNQQAYNIILVNIFWSLIFLIKFKI